MQNFVYDIPTKVFFGKDQIKNLASQIKGLGNKVLLTYGSGSIKTFGLYDQVMEIFNHNQIKYRELSDIEPNPDISSVREGIRLCKENQIQLILAVGGGSVIDASKAIALGYYYDGDPRDIFTGKGGEVKQALPFGTVLTVAATGSEMNNGCVISNRELTEKTPFMSPLIRPKFSILDPSYSFSVPPRHTIAGIVDMMSHVFEQYFSPTEATEIQDNIAEGILQTCIYYGHIAVAEPENYDARANLMRSASLALNRLIGFGKEHDWSTHKIEHALSALYNIPHGEGLAIVFPNRMTYVLGDGKDEKILNKFVDFAVNIRNLPSFGDPLTIAKAGIQSLRNFRDQLGAPSKLSTLGIHDPDLELLASKAVPYGEIGGFKRLNKEDVIKILEMCQ